MRWLIGLCIKRRAGELIKEGQEKGDIAQIGRPEKRLHDETFSIEQPKHLLELGIDKTQSHRWQTIANMPEEELNAL